MWFEVAIVASLFAVGNIVFGHFEEGRPKWRRVLKFVVVTALGVWISSRFGRAWFWALLGGMAIPVAFIHVWWLPRLGINGWTGEPREKYYALRGWTPPRPSGAHGGGQPAG